MATGAEGLENGETGVCGQRVDFFLVNEMAVTNPEAFMLPVEEIVTRLEIVDVDLCVVPAHDFFSHAGMIEKLPCGENKASCRREQPRHLAQKTLSERRRGDMVEYGQQKHGVELLMILV